MNIRAQQPLPVLADAVLPASEGSRRFAQDAALVVGACLFTALLAQVKIPLGFTPVPITGQTFAVLVVGAALGSRRGATAMLLYLVAGTWLPFYAGGASGFVFSIASGGYIVGFIPAAFVVGWLSEQGWDRGPRVLLSMLAGNVVLYVPGLLWLATFAPAETRWTTTMEWGLYPFIIGDAIKLVAASLLLPVAWEAVNLVRGRKQ
ncbi:MAG: biotin transporter BioY [Chloroflexota bacterium]|nr:biotin transporter BioY [Chloroflexota bacterium]